MKTAVVVCPGRGTYNKAELGYLGAHFPEAALLDAFDAEREANGQDTLRALDGAAKFSLARHTRGDNASGLIYAATVGDFLSIDREAVEIVAVTGNSMGWYSALACAGALSPTDGFRVANTMGTLMQQSLIGGQTLYPFVDDEWVVQPSLRDALMAQVRDIDGREDHALSLSIRLGGMLVLAGNDAGLEAFEATVEPRDERYPMRLANHAAFHSPAQAPVAAQGREALQASLFDQPDIPMIDGRGAIWWPGATNTQALWDYTLDHQVTRPYDFTHAIAVAAREFAPDLFILTGPGTTLGGATIQSLIQTEWRGMRGKSGFRMLQSESNVLVSMGMPEQRTQVC